MIVQWKSFCPGRSRDFGFLERQAGAGGVSVCCEAVASGRRWSLEQKGT